VLSPGEDVLFLHLPLKNPCFPVFFALHLRTGRVLGADMCSMPAWPMLDIVLLRVVNSSEDGGGGG
jgi:hypothetical protein